MDINELWKNIQGEFAKVNERIGGVEIRVGNLEAKVENLAVRVGNLEKKVENLDTRVGNMEIEINEIKYDNKIIKQNIDKINQRLEVIQNVNLVNILNKQKDIMREINREIKTNNLEHENCRYRQERIEKALGIA